MALTQLATSGGNADKFLNSEPEITLWRSLYKRHSPFASEDVSEVLSGDVDFAGQATSLITKSGDCIGSMTLHVTLPNLKNFQARSDGDDPEFLAWSNGAPLALIDSVSLEIGGTKIDSWTGIELMAWYRLTMRAEKRVALWKMIGYYDDYDPTNPQKCPSGDTDYYIPLPFFNCLANGHSIPIAALSYHDVRVNIVFKPYQHLIKSNARVRSLYDPSSGLGPSIKAELHARHIFLGQKERQKLVSSRFETLIQVQQSTSFPVSGDSTQRKLSLGVLQHPTKALIVFCHTSKAGDVIDGNDWFNWDPIMSEDGGGGGGGGGDDDDEEAEAEPEEGEEDEGEREDPIVSMKASLNGSDLVTSQSGKYWRLLHTYEHWNSPTIEKGSKIYTINFALNPQDTVQPSGHVNFGRADAAHLHLELHPKIPRGRIHVVALTWQILRIASGMGGLALAS